MGTAAALVVGGLSLAKGVGEYNQAKSATRSMRREAATAIDNRKKEIQTLVAKQKIGYIQSGVELEGAAQAVMQDSYRVGAEDIKAISGSYAQQIKNTMTAARANLLGSIASAATSAMGAYNSFGSSMPTYNVTGLANTVSPASNVRVTNASYGV